MARRLPVFALIASVAFAFLSVVRAESDCLADGESCVLGPAGCPSVCCTGVPMRMSGASRLCPRNRIMFDDFVFSTLPPTDGSAVPETLSVPVSSSASGSGASLFSSSSAASATTDDSATTNALAEESDAPVTEEPTPEPTEKSQDVESLQSTTSFGGNRNGLNGSTTIAIVIAAIACVGILVAAVVYKRKDQGGRSQPAPGSAYHGGGPGMTPDNRSLDGMMDGGARATTDSMMQLPVLSMGSRKDARFSRASSPFGHSGVRISSPAHRGGTNEDMAFNVDTASRAGSSVQVELVVDKNGVVAL